MRNGWVWGAASGAAVVALMAVLLWPASAPSLIYVAIAPPSQAPKELAQVPPAAPAEARKAATPATKPTPRERAAAPVAEKPPLTAAPTAPAESGRPVALPAPPAISEPEQKPEPAARPATPAQEPAKPRSVTIPAGTLLTVRLREPLSTEHNQTDQSFSVTLDQPLVVDGLVIAERGSLQTGRITALEKSGRVKGRASMTLELTELTTSDGQKVDIHTQPFTHAAAGTAGKDAAKAGVAAAIGAAIGAAVGGGKGAAIGAGAGGAAGGGWVLATRGSPAKIDSETRIQFRVTEPVTLTEKID